MLVKFQGCLFFAKPDLPTLEYHGRVYTAERLIYVKKLNEIKIMKKVKMPKLPRKIKKAAFSDRWNYGLTKYRKTNKFQPKKGSIAYQICMWYCDKLQEDRGYIADKEIEKHRLFKIK